MLEMIFSLMYHGGFSYSDAYALPIQHRLWFITRINRELAAQTAAQQPEKRPPNESNARENYMRNNGLKSSASG